MEAIELDAVDALFKDAYSSFKSATERIVEARAPGAQLAPLLEAVSKGEGDSYAASTVLKEEVRYNMTQRKRRAEYQSVYDQLLEFRDSLITDLQSVVCAVGVAKSIIEEQQKLYDLALKRLEEGAPTAEELALSSPAVEMRPIVLNEEQIEKLAEDFQLEDK